MVLMRWLDLISPCSGLDTMSPGLVRGSCTLSIRVKFLSDSKANSSSYYYFFFQREGDFRVVPT